MGQLDDSLAASQRALQLEPLDFLISDHMSWHYLMARDYRSAIAAGLKVIELNPDRWPTYHHIVEAHENLGEFDQAVEAAHQAFNYPRLDEFRTDQGKRKCLGIVPVGLRIRWRVSFLLPFSSWVRHRLPRGGRGKVAI